MRNRWLRYFARLAAWAMGVVGLLLALIFTLAWWVVVHPSDAWNFTQHHFLPADLHVSWQEIHWKPEKLTWLHWNIEWEVKGLKVEKGSPKISAPVDDVALVFSFSVFSPATRADFSKVLVHADQPIIFEGSAAPESQTEQSPFQTLQSYLHYLALGNEYASMRTLDLNIKSFRYLPPANGEPVDVMVAVQKPADESSPEAVRFGLSAVSKSMSTKLNGQLYPAQVGGTEPFLNARLDFSGFKATETALLIATYNQDTLKAAVKGPFSYEYQNKRVRMEPSLELSMVERQVEVTLTTSVSDIPGPLVKLDRLEAHMAIPLHADQLWSEAPTSFSIGGPVDLFFIDKDMRPPLETSCQCKIPERLKVSLGGRMWLKTLLADRTTYKKPAVDARLSIESVKNRLFHVELAAELKLFKEDTHWVFEPRLDSEAHIFSFKGLRNFLDARNIMIPAPFDVLDGTIDVTARGPVKSDKDSSETVINTKVSLGSEHQRINVSADTNVDLDSALKGMSVRVKFLIDDFQIELPPLDPIAGMPKFARDARVQMEPPKQPVPPKFRMDFYFEAKTTKPGAIRLLSKYSRPHVPITLSANRSIGGELTGTVQFEPFDVQYLRRTIHVEQLRILIDSNENGGFPIDGRLRVDQTQYRVFMDLSGTLRSPSIRLSSEPYLPRSEIISVLLYDRTSDQLISGDAETAGSFEAAMADRAIGLIGLWALASTPIKSFSYNPVTKVYSATVQLSDGLTAGIGTNWEEAAQLEVRKRVSKRWVLSASWSPSETDRTQVGRLTLQWEKRF